MSRDVTAAGRTGRLPEAFTVPGCSSFSEFVGQVAPELLPARRPLPPGASLEAPHGTTIVALEFAGGVIMAGDRRSTMGNLIANRDMEKVFAADEYAVVGIAGTAGLAIELVKLYQVELEHYEKIEGTLMSVEGKANRLANMIRGQLGLAMQGLAVVPIFAGYDAVRRQRPDLLLRRDRRLLPRARPPQHRLGLALRPGLDEEALAPRDSTPTPPCGSPSRASTTPPTTTRPPAVPDLGRRIWPTVAVVDVEGVRFVSEESLAAVVELVVADRRGNPGGNPVRGGAR